MNSQIVKTGTNCVARSLCCLMRGRASRQCSPVCGVISFPCRCVLRVSVRQVVTLMLLLYSRPNPRHEHSGRNTNNNTKLQVTSGDTSQLIISTRRFFLRELMTFIQHRIALMKNRID
ncbi:hypothetical protein ElyMa_003850700 [Elysia marginata]|uniref:Uncharacterized protein n=1 Tax=Elysia marginata TaxID=1093978 RepID=A0AAV4FI85_9GAST|nr:hypothetical protein ElyMa_003850700 [Elysia marginata]